MAKTSTSKPSDGWVDVGTEFNERICFMDVMGLEGSGKTSFALTAPGPIGLIHNAEKVGGIIQRVVRETGKSIREHKYGYVATGNEDTDKRLAEPVWEGVRSKYFDAYSWARTINLDTGNGIWENIRMARFGTLKPKGNRMDVLYTKVNNEIRSMLSQVRFQQRTNLITVHQMGDQYVDKIVNGATVSQRTGKSVRKGGFKEIPFLADVIVECYRGTNGEFLAQIRKGWFNATVERIEIDADFMQAMGYSGLNFSSVMSWITDAPEEEWS